MKIENLNIIHFGAFHQQQCTLNPGVNIIYGENEAGKTTVHQFIQAMLFGVDRLRGKASKNDEYSRFQPWDQGRSYEGTLVIEHRGEKYRILRNFYKEDEFFKVEQLSSGREILLPGNRLEHLISGMNRSNFKNTLSIGQLGSMVDSRFGLSLQAYMANVRRTKNEEVDFSRTLEFLKKQRREQADKGSEKKLLQLEEQIKALQSETRDRDELAGDICRQQAQLEALRQTHREVQSRGKEQRRREQKERMEAVRLIEENNYIASRYKEKKEAYERMKQKAAEEDFDAMKSRWEEANENYDNLADSYSQLIGRNLAIMFSVMMFGLIPVIGVFFLKSSFGLKAAVIGLLIGGLAAVGALLQAGRRRMASRLLESKQQLDDRHAEMEKHMFGRHSADDLKQLRQEIKGLRAKYEALQEPLRPYIEKYGDDISLDTEEDEAEEMETYLENEEKQSRILERLLVKKELLDEKTAELEILESEKEILEKEMAEEGEELSVIDTCMTIIRDLSEEIHSDFGPALNREVSKMMNELTEGRYSKVIVDNELNLKVDDGSRFIDGDRLSTGTKEQLCLALRLAMVKLLFPEDEVPVLFDDSFVFYDDKRLARTLMWLSGQPFSQVIIFTCQHREMDILDRMGVAYTPVYLS